MKILLTAHACHPTWGSESSVGWKVMRLLSREHEVCVLTSKRNEAGMKGAIDRGEIPKNVRVVYAGPDLVLSKNEFFAKLQEWPYYRKFLQSALPVAERLHREQRFDLVHHVTFAAWRMGAPFWKLGIPQIFGPIGGGEQFDFRFLSLLSPSAGIFEATRVIANWRACSDPEVVNCMKHSSCVLVSNPETERIARRLGVTDEHLRRLMVVFFPDEILNKWALGSPKPAGKLRLIAGGALEGRKGVALAIRALALAAERGLDFEYRFTMGGPESAHMKQLAESLGIGNRVVFSDTLPRPEYEALMKTSHVYLLPSLRDNTPSALMEAMLAECVPVVADCGGPSLLVKEGCGIKIPLSETKPFISRLSEELISLDANRGLVQTMGAAARKWICEEFSEQTYLKKIEATYAFALRKAGA